MTTEVDVSTIQPAMANPEVSPVESNKDVESEVQPESREDAPEAPQGNAETNKDVESEVQPESREAEAPQGNGETAETNKDVESEVQPETPHNGETAESNKDVESEVSEVQAPQVNGEFAEGAAGSDEASVVSESKEVKQSDVEEASKEVELVLDATKLMEKLDVGESSDDPSSSLDSTANSGACYAAREDVNNAASSEESFEGGSSRPKKRIDLQHQFVREIVKIQHERDDYEKQCKEQEKGGKQVASSALKPEGTVQDRPHTAGEVEKGTRPLLFYRPPNLRNDTGDFRNDTGSSRLPQGLKITLDTQKQKRSIQPAVAESETNLTVTYDPTKKERHVQQVERKSADNDGQVKSPKGDASPPSHFEFKATTPTGKNVTSRAERNGERNNRDAANYKGAGLLGKAPDNGSVEATRNKREELVIPPLPPKDKPFAAELRWSDMVESEEESPLSTNSTPDVVAGSNRQRNTNRRRKHHRNERSEQRRDGAPSQPEVAPETGNTERRSVFDRLEDRRQPQHHQQQPQQQQRRSVFERLGPRIEAPGAPPAARSRTVHYEREGRQNFGSVSEREYQYEAESGVRGGKQPRDGRQKRSGFELYVPRRGG